MVPIALAGRYSNVAMQGLHWALVCLVVLSNSGTGAQGCTVLSFTNHSFSTNVVRLLHSLPIFDGQNGTVYLDSAASNHKCHADGGLHEFLILGKHAGEHLLALAPDCSSLTAIASRIMHPSICSKHFQGPAGV